MEDIFFDHRTLDIEHWPPYTAHCTAYSAHCTPYTAHKLHTVHYKKYTAHYKLRTTHCTLHTTHCTRLYAKQGTLLNRPVIARDGRMLQKLN